MRPLTVIVAGCAIALVVATFAMTWFAADLGTTSVSFRPGEVTICDGSACRTQSSDGADFDSTWLGLLGAAKIAAGLGVAACLGIAAMSHLRRLSLSNGKITRGHLYFIGLIALGIVAGTVLTQPSEVSMRAGCGVALVALFTSMIALTMIRDDDD